MTTLKEAREKGKLDKFIKEREAEEGDADALEKSIKAMASKKDEETLGKGTKPQP